MNASIIYPVERKPHKTQSNRLELGHDEYCMSTAQIITSAIKES